MKHKKDFTAVTGKKYDGMLGRCYRRSDRGYANYGGRGIKVCSAWIKDIAVFRAWIVEELDRLGLSKEDFIKDSKNWQLDRIDCNGHYEPKNCRLIGVQENSRNKRSGRRTMVSAEGEVITV